MPVLKHEARINTDYCHERSQNSTVPLSIGSAEPVQ
jgi:hypothetical protein